MRQNPKCQHSADARRILWMDDYLSVLEVCIVRRSDREISCGEDLCARTTSTQEEGKKSHSKDVPSSSWSLVTPNLFFESCAIMVADTLERRLLLQLPHDQAIVMMTPMEHHSVSHSEDTLARARYTVQMLLEVIRRPPYCCKSATSELCLHTFATIVLCKLIRTYSNAAVSFRDSSAKKRLCDFVDHWTPHAVSAMVSSPSFALRHQIAALPLERLGIKVAGSISIMLRKSMLGGSREDRNVFRNGLTLLQDKKANSSVRCIPTLSSLPRPWHP